MEITDKIDVTGGYIHVSECDLTVPIVEGMLSRYSPSLKIKFKPSSKHITVSMMDVKSADVLEQLRKQLPDLDIIHFIEFNLGSQEVSICCPEVDESA